ncbi:MAG: META domain-containing protein [Coriobacteriia bacterium]|nr:META domain-containing protein [Coriobacteriia bacterium]
MLRFRLVLLVCLCALLAVASSGCSAQPSNAKLLEAHSWKVDKLVGNAYTGSSPITAKFSAGKINGSTGVNVYNATYVAPKANDIAITMGAMTQRAGSPVAMRAETNYVKALGNAVSYAADEDSLTLFDSSGVATVEYVVDVPVPLVGTNWKMVMYNNGHGGFQGAESSATVTALFAKDGTVSGNGGVNQYNATYTSSDSTIKVGPIVSTKMAGPEDLMAQETAYLAALEKATTYAMEGDIMTLRDSTGAAMVGYRQTK